MALRASVNYIRLCFPSLSLAELTVSKRVHFHQIELDSHEETAQVEATRDADNESMGGQSVRTSEEVTRVLGEKMGRMVDDYYGVMTGGNFESRSD